MNVKRIYDLLTSVKTRANSIAEGITDFPVAKLDEIDNLIDLINDIEGDLNHLQIHLESAKQLIGKESD